MPVKHTDPDTGEIRLTISKAEAAKALGIGTRLLQVLMRRGQIPCWFRPGGPYGRRIVFSVAALEAWIADRVKETHSKPRV